MGFDPIINPMKPSNVIYMELPHPYLKKIFIRITMAKDGVKSIEWFYHVIRDNNRRCIAK